MGGNEESSNSSLKEYTKENSRETQRALKEIIFEFYNSLEELGYLPKDLYEMDMNELENVLINRRKGIARETYMIGMLSRTALAKDVPESPEKAFPGMFPKPKSYKMPEFLKEKYYRENGGGIGE